MVCVSHFHYAHTFINVAEGEGVKAVKLKDRDKQNGSSVFLYFLN